VGTNYQSLEELLKGCTVRIRAEGGHGTGFFVAPGLILTCAHVLADALKKNKAITVYCNFNQKTIPVQQVGAEDIFPESYPDLALLRVDLHDHPCVLLGTKYQAFIDFFSYGYTQEHPNGESTTVECEGTLEDGGTLIKLKEGQVQPGSSGSPLLNTESGAVCGMIQLTRDRLSDLGGAGIPMSTVFTSYPELEEENLAFHHHDLRWSSLLKDQKIKGLNSVVILLYTEPGKIARPKFFVGRAEILTQVGALLDQACRVLLTGMAGIGKTAMAQVLVDQQLQKGKGEVFWIEVKYEKPDAIIEALADRLEDNQISKLRNIDERIPALRALLERSKVGLIVLENVHNTSAVDKILGAIPDEIPVLITSRQRFAVDQIIGVDVLSRADALKILEQTSGVKDLSNNSDAIFLCEQLGYHPYALELAGSMMRELDRTPKELRRRLADAPLDLSSSTRGRLRALLDDSAANLDANTRAVLFAFGAFPSNGATSVLLAAYLNKTVEDIFNALDELIRRNLIKRRPGTEFYFMHDLTYYYVTAQARPDSEEDTQILVEGVLRYLTAHRHDFDILGLDLANLLDIARSTAGIDAVKLVSYLILGNFPLQEGKSYADDRGYSLGLIEQLDRAIDVIKGLGSEYSKTLHYLVSKRGHAAFRRADYESAVVAFQIALETAPDPNREVKCLATLARTLAFAGQVSEARSIFVDAHQKASGLGDEMLELFVLEQESWVAGHLEDFETALTVARKQVEIATARYAQGDDPDAPERLYFAFLNLGSAELDIAKRTHHNYVNALHAHEKAAELAQNLDSKPMEAIVLKALGEDYYYLGDIDKAQTALSQALHDFKRLNLKQKEEDLIQLMEAINIVPINIDGGEGYDNQS